MLRFLKVKLEAITDDFNNGIKAAQKEAKEFEKTIRPSKDLLREMGTAATAAGLAVVGSMTAMAKAAANYGDELLDASKRTGASVQELARLKFAAEQSGASFADVSTGLRILARNLDDAATKTGAQRKAFQDLGVSITDSTGKLLPMNTVLLDVADRFAKMEDGAEKAALAQELFGRGGAALIPVLNEGSAGLRLMGDEAERLGLVISRDAAVAGDEFNDTLEGIKGATLGLANAIGSAILPSLTSLAEKARDGIVAFKDFTREHEYLTKAIFAAGAALTGAGGLLLGLTAVLTIAPNVVRALDLVSKAAHAIAASALAAQLGVAALGAALGIGIGMLVNWGIEGTKVRHVMDDLSRSFGKFLLSGGLREANIGLFRSTEQLNEALQKQGIIVERGTDSISSYNARVVEASKALKIYKVSAVEQSIAQANLNDDIARFAQLSQGPAKSGAQVLNEIYEKQAASAKKSADETKKNTEELERQWQRLGQIRLDRILDDITTAQRRSTTGFDEWIESVETGTSALFRLQRELQSNPLGFDRLVMGDQEVWRRNADNRTQIFGDALQKMNGLAVTHAEFTGKVLRKPADEMSKAFATALGNVTSGFANALTDSLFKAKNFGDALLGLAQSTAKNLLNALLVGLLSPLTEKLAGLGASLGGLFGGAGSAAAGSAGSVAGSAGSVAGSVGGAAGGAAGGLAGGLISAAGGIIGGGLSALATMRTEGTLNAIEYSTRAAEIHLRSMIDQILWPVRHDVLAIRESSHMSTTQLDAIFNALSGGGSTSSRVTSASMSSAAPAPTATVQLVSNFAPVIHVDGLPEDWQTIFRERISPELMEAFRLNFRGSLDEMIRLLRSSGVVAATA